MTTDKQAALEWQNYAANHSNAARLFIFGGDRCAPRIIGYQNEAARGYAWARYYVEKMNEAP